LHWTRYIIIIIIIIIFAQGRLLHSQGTWKLAKCPEWLGNCQRIGQAHCIKTLNCHGNSLVQKRSFPRMSCAARRPPANICQEMLSLIRQRTQRLNSHWTENMAG